MRIHRSKGSSMRFFMSYNAELQVIGASLTFFVGYLALFLSITNDLRSADYLLNHRELRRARIGFATRLARTRRSTLSKYEILGTIVILCSIVFLFRSL